VEVAVVDSVGAAVGVSTAARRFGCEERNESVGCGVSLRIIDDDAPLKLLICATFTFSEIAPLSNVPATPNALPAANAYDMHDSIANKLRQGTHHHRMFRLIHRYG